MDIIAIVLLVIFNGQLARRKNHSPTLWGFLTVVGYFVIGTIASLIYFAFNYRGDYTPQGIQTYIKQLSNEPLKALLITMFAIGGGLVIRFILEKTKPNGPPQKPQG